MCGIVGCITRDQRDDAWTAALERMTGAIVHRGPDDGGIWFDAEHGVGLGNRRLAIVDLSPNGHQPMTSASERFVLTFNGEIYNHRQLRTLISETGSAPRYRGGSDTEVLLAGFECWGVAETLTRAAGMFGLAVWDRAQRTLLLARDRLGEKPLYYGWQGDSFLFGSELKALAVHPDFQNTIDRDAAALFFQYRYIPAPYSIYAGIAKLPPGAMVQLTEDDVRMRATPVPEAYWSVRAVAEAGQSQPFRGDVREAEEELHSLLTDAVGMQMVADVPLGALLSGGVDSSTIVALMQAQSARPVRTFTIGSTDAQYDESSQAKAVAAHLGTDHTELIVSPEQALAVIPRLPLIYDEPFADPSQIPTLLVSELARAHVTVALSGDGGDELFGGYSRHVWVPAIWNRIGRFPLPARRALSSLMLAPSPATWTTLFERLDPVLPGSLKQRNPGDKLQKLAPVLTAPDADALYRALLTHWRHDDLVAGARALSSNESDPALAAALPTVAERMMLIDAISFLPDDVLVKVDRASMAVSLETRAPFLDHRVVEFAWQLPLAMRIRDGKGKVLLRRVLERYVPAGLIDRPKTGFGLPIAEWLRGPLREWADHLLSPASIQNHGYVNPIPVQRIWNEHLSGRRNWEPFLWDVLMFEAWVEATHGSGSSVHGQTPRGRGAYASLSA